MKDETKLQKIIAILKGEDKVTTVELAQMKLEDGETTIEAEAFEPGQPVMVITEDEQQIALPIGDYKLEDGKILVVAEEGVIAEIKDEMEEEAPAAEAEVAATDDATATPTLPKKVIESVSKESHFSAEDKQKLEDRIGELEVALAAKIEDAKEALKYLEDQAEKSAEDEVVEVIEMAAAKPLVHNPEPKATKAKFKFGANRKESVQDRVMNKISNLK